MEAKTLKKIVLLALIVAAVAAFFAFDLGQYLTLSYIKESKARFDAYYSQNRASVISAYMGIYVLVTALSLPGAAVMTLAGGAVFGLAAGTVAVSFASTIGATLACLASRFLLRDWVQGRFADRLARVNEGMAREGAFYLFTMRLIPAIPFFAINLVMGLTKMRLSTFYWVSQVGMLPGTVLYVNAGRELANVESLSGIASPRVVLSFVLLGVFPFVSRRAIGYYRARKAGPKKTKGPDRV